MDIFKKLANGWKKMTLVEKIGVVVDAICSIGCGAIAGSIGKSLSEGRSLPEKICIRTASTGLGIAAGDIASKALCEGYVEPIARIFDKQNVQAPKEGADHE